MINAEGAPAANVNEQTDGRSNRGRLILAGAGVVIAAVIVAVVLVILLGGDDGSASVPTIITVEEITNRVETERPREASAPAAVTARTSSPRRAKSAASMEGAIRTGCCM